MDYNSAEDREQFHAMLLATAQLYGKPEPATTVVRMYFEALQRFSVDDVRQALNRHVVDPDQGAYMPKPADIVRHINGNTETQAEAAWTKVDRAIRQVGNYRTVAFDDIIIHAVISDMGGWIGLGQLEEREYPFKHTEFVKRYRAYSLRPPEPGAVPGKLLGHEDAHNVSHGFAAADPVLIGNPKRAMILLQAGAKAPVKTSRMLSEVVAQAMNKLPTGTETTDAGE